MAGLRDLIACRSTVYASTRSRWPCTGFIFFFFLSSCGGRFSSIQGCVFVGIHKFCYFLKSDSSFFFHGTWGLWMIRVNGVRESSGKKFGKLSMVSWYSFEENYFMILGLVGRIFSPVSRYENTWNITSRYPWHLTLDTGLSDRATLILNDELRKNFNNSQV